MGERRRAASGTPQMTWDRRSEHEVAPTERYVRIKTAFRRKAADCVPHGALRRLKGVKLAVFLSLALHIGKAPIQASIAITSRA